VFSVNISIKYRENKKIAMTIMDEKTEEREYKPFQHIRDNYPKYLFTLDQLQQQRDGIAHQNLIELMSQNKDL